MIFKKTVFPPKYSIQDFTSTFKASKKHKNVHHFPKPTTYMWQHPIAAGMWQED